MRPVRMHLSLDYEIDLISGFLLSFERDSAQRFEAGEHFVGRRKLLQEHKSNRFRDF